MFVVNMHVLIDRFHFFVVYRLAEGETTSRVHFARWIIISDIYLRSDATISFRVERSPDHNFISGQSKMI